jgi:hypothetical protein
MSYCRHDGKLLECLTYACRINAVDFVQKTKSQLQSDEIPFHQCITDIALRASRVPESVVQKATTSCMRSVACT